MSIELAVLALASATGVCAQGKPAAPAAKPNAGKLAALEQAYRSGVLTREEYEAKKTELLSGASPANQTGPLPDRAAPTGFTVMRDPQGTGRIITGRFRTPAGLSALAFLRQVLGVVRGYFDDVPTLTAAVSDQTGEQVQAFFSAAIAGQPVGGLVWVALGHGEGRCSFLLDRPESLAHSFARLAQQLPGGSPGGAAPPVQLTRISLPDGSATIGLPPGWRMTFGQNGAVDLEGSRGEQVSLGAAAPISTNQMARMAGMLVAPYSSPVQALQVLTPQISPKLARLGRPPVRLVRIVESAPAQYPGGQSAYVLYEADVGGRRYTALALIITASTGMQQWMYYTSVVSAPSEVFHGELPLLLQVWQSWSVSGETHMRRLHAAMRSMQQTAELARAAAAERTRAGLSTAEGWDQYIRGVQTVEHKGSGFRGEVENTKVDGLLRALNGSGTGNWRAVPPSELIPK